MLCWLHRALALVLACCLWAHAAHAAPPRAAKVASVEGITEYRLPNGLRFLLFPDQSRATVTVNMTYLVGSRHENYGETGMAHLLEHLMFKGTPHHNNIFQELSARGMDFNGTTAFDRTNYYETFPASDQQLRWALGMEAERMVHAFIARRDLDSEMTVVRNEMEEGENSPGRVLSEKVQAAAFQWHSYGRSTIGARADVENVDVPRLQAFYRQYYQPDNAVVVIAGNFEPGRVVQWMEAAFGPIPRPRRVLPVIPTLDPAQDGERQVILRRVGSTQLLEALYHILPGGHPEYPAFEVLAIVLGDTPSGRLHKALVETHKATAVYADSEGLREPGFITFGAQVREGDDLAAAQEAFLAALEKLGQAPVTEAEFKRAKVKLFKDFDVALNDPQQMGVTLSEDIAAGDWRLFFLFRDRLRALTLADVQRIAQAYFKPANRTLGLFIPDEKPERAPPPARIDVGPAVRDYKGTKPLPPGEAFVATPQNIEARVKRSTLANGMKLAVMPKKTRGGTLSVALRLHFGDEQAVFGRVPAGSMVASMLMHGTTRHTRQEIEDEFDRLQSSVVISGDETSASITLETLGEYLPQSLALLAEVLRQPVFTAEEFEEIRRARLAALEASRSDPQTLATISVYRHDNPYPRGHFRYIETLEEQITGVKGATVEAVKAFYSDFYGGSYAELTAVGEIEPEQFRLLAQNAFGDWVTPRPYARIPAPYHAITPLQSTIDVADKSNAIYYARMPLPISDTDPDYPALLLGNYLFGGSNDSRLFNRVRQKEGLSYSVGSSFNVNSFDPNSDFSIYAIYAPQNRARLGDALRDEFARVLREGVTPAEVARAKSAIEQERRLSLMQDAPLAATLALYLRLGRTMAFVEQTDRAIAGLTPPQIQSVLRKYLRPDAMAAVYAGAFAAPPK